MKTYQYQIPREQYMGDRRKAHDPKRVHTFWDTQFETTDYNEIEQLIEGKFPEVWKEDGTPIYNEKDDVYRVTVTDVVKQQGEIHSAWDEWQDWINRQIVSEAK